MKTNFIKITSLAFLIVLFSGCKNNRDSKIENKLDSDFEQQSEQEDMQSARYTINYDGTYIGMLPCADCKGIHTELTLQGDKYTMKRQYQDIMNSDVITDTGKITWDGPNTIILEMIDMPNAYLVKENELVALDQNGHLVTGENAAQYILRKR